ncbi:MAG: carbohydrate ABC transporter substrate-binding protein, partial [Aquiluna sp.]
GDYTNADVFTLPAPAGGDLGVIGGGDLAAAFNLDGDTVEVLNFILSDQVGSIMAQRASFVSPHATFDSSLYPDPMTKKFGETMSAAAVFGFDGSDRMPSEVNAEFWASGTEFVAGRISWDEAAANINSKY